jgi:hypothetical protein
LPMERAASAEDGRASAKELRHSPKETPPSAMERSRSAKGPRRPTMEMAPSPRDHRHDRKDRDRNGPEATRDRDDLGAHLHGRAADPHGGQRPDGRARRRGSRNRSGRGALTNDHCNEILAVAAALGEKWQRAARACSARCCAARQLMSTGSGGGRGHRRCCGSGGDIRTRTVRRLCCRDVRASSLSGPLGSWEPEHHRSVTGGGAPASRRRRRGGGADRRNLLGPIRLQCARRRGRR